MRNLTFRRWLPALLALAAVVPMVGAACGGDADTAEAGAAAPAVPGAIPAAVGKDDKADLTGAGATFPQPIYQAWFDDYRKVASGVKVNYQGVGSGGGINQFMEKTVDFGASDVGISAVQLEKAPDAQLLPTVIGAVVLTYNLPGLKAPLKLDGPALADIYLGSIKKWNDPALAALNPGVALPNADIQVAYRSDSSGTSGVFTEYLSKVSPEWKDRVGMATAPKWPAGQGGQGNPGVATIVKQTPNSIGYVELTYATQNKLPFADLKNRAGKFVTPSIESASAAAAGVTVPEAYQVSLTDANGDTAYPIASFTYLILYKTTGACAKQTPLADMLWWAFHDTGAQAAVQELGYAPLPPGLLPRIEATLKDLKCDNGAKASLKGG
ncbi:MAG: phosphate ABC transporter substrate-binding protein PstS [Dehalococcoidia bacterium]